ncbi:MULTISPECIES: plasmid mobilization protein [Acinetobacter]|jgi:hypothetical protein|uniref:Mobilization protein n=1 Tax=Acinetobacter chengduensis TaxID=2420890 RepID=A0ABX9TRF8_9GAMM|nr:MULTISPECIES: hypothetical protein [Acinetobacter]MDD2945153.1 hypothetical protein [Acinetobacter sp.]RLL17618.1 hypothetical protein D9K81_16865 [Acinetobacter chengduensis]
MKVKTSRNKQIIVRLTADEHQDINDACKALQLNQSDYIRKKVLSNDYNQLVDQRDIHTIRMIGIVLPKILIELKDKDLIPKELTDLTQLIDELKIIVRRLNDQVR